MIAHAPIWSRTGACETTFPLKATRKTLAVAQL